MLEYRQWDYSNSTTPWARTNEQHRVTNYTIGGERKRNNDEVNQSIDFTQTPSTLLQRAGVGGFLLGPQTQIQRGSFKIHFIVIQRKTCETQGNEMTYLQM